MNGKDLIKAGLRPGKKFGQILQEINAAETYQEQQEILIRCVTEQNEEDARLEALKMSLVDPKDAPRPIINMTANTPEEHDNLNKVIRDINNLLMTPGVHHAAIMPDACPTGSAMPVGAVVSSEHLHPGWHSADICCSLYASNFGDTPPAAVMDAVCDNTHFGPGGRKDPPKMPEELRDQVMSINKFITRRGEHLARTHLMSQGDGNHFAFVGTSKATGDTWLITHHGSRGFGANVYKEGMKVAEEWRRKLCKKLYKGHAFLPGGSTDCNDYWYALQTVRAWTKVNHELLHEMVEDVVDREIIHRRWNEHNFVFRRDDLYWHAKGATPIDVSLMPDTDGRQIIPLHMARPVLFVMGERNDLNLGFAPHGVGRNMSRTAHRKIKKGQSDQSIFDEETAGLDVRFYSGEIDITELPSAYKDADRVIEDMEQRGLAQVVDQIMPYGAIMAGDWEKNAPWRNKRNKKGKGK